MNVDLSRGAPPGLVLPQGLIATLTKAYSKPVRAYHHLGHIEEMLASIASVTSDVGWRQPREVHLAALYHDAIYQAGAADNEPRSADLAAEAIRHWLGSDGIDVPCVRRLIELTALHGKVDPGSLDLQAALFLDCDMAILGAPASRFAEYDQGISEEYRALPPELFAVGRRAFVERLLTSKRIFLSDYFRERLEARARANLGALRACYPDS